MPNDITLTTYVNIMNAKTERIEPSTGFDVTLFVNGDVITGNLIPAWQMLEDFGKGKDQGTDERGPFALCAEQAKADEQRVRELLSREDDIPTTDDDREFLDISGPYFVNLANAKWMASNGQLAPGNGGVLMRVKLESVDAFVVGTMSAAGTAA